MKKIATATGGSLILLLITVLLLRLATRGNWCTGITRNTTLDRLWSCEVCYGRGGLRLFHSGQFVGHCNKDEASALSAYIGNCAHDTPSASCALRRNPVTSLHCPYRSRTPRLTLCFDSQRTRLLGLWLGNTTLFIPITQLTLNKFGLLLRSSFNDPLSGYI